ncbi:Zinc finger BED domain-containing protein RICESLEEPER 2 [Glycine soja]|uniref:Zinc finger BED domain-containing protein RICESLEEPER 2 n=1 Tax=Glycine soja TaxID=3848 RepID=A0A445G7Q2_GLYSO|nr:Zinc finger BED domain-containing protein RICESLEEPER 2 [Glycine soja]
MYPLLFSVTITQVDVPSTCTTKDVPSNVLRQRILRRQWHFLKVAHWLINHQTIEASNTQSNNEEVQTMNVTYGNSERQDESNNDGCSNVEKAQKKRKHGEAAPLAPPSTNPTPTNPIAGEPGRVFTITVDNASSNDVAISYLKNRMENWNTHPLKGEHMHVRCCAHILNLVVNDGLKEYHPSISSRIRNAVRYVRASPSRMERFKICISEARILDKSTMQLDVPTRWNSTYIMLESALKFQKAFKRLGEKCAECDIASQGQQHENYATHSLERRPPEIDEAENSFAAGFEKIVENNENLNKNEVDLYLMESLEKKGNSTFDILTWWKVNSNKYPILSLIHRDVLAMPVSTVASESAFSTGEDDHVYRFKSLEKLPLVSLAWFTKDESKSSFLKRCKESGNAEIVYCEAI